VCNINILHDDTIILSEFIILPVIALPAPRPPGFVEEILRCEAFGVRSLFLFFRGQILEVSRCLKKTRFRHGKGALLHIIFCNTPLSPPLSFVAYNIAQQFLPQDSCQDSPPYFIIVIKYLDPRQYLYIL